MARTHPWQVSDELWEHVSPFIPQAPSHAKGGRPRMPDRDALSAIIYVLRTGIQWNALPRELGASSTVHDRFQEWERAGVFRRLWQVGLQQYDELEGIQWEWQAVDGVMTKAPFGHAATGANPTDRGKKGTKRSLLTDGAGIPLALVVDGANRHDMKLLSATLEGIVIARPEPTEEQPQHLCLDAGYDYETTRQAVVDHQYLPHIRSRGQEQQEKALVPGSRARRWVVERTHSWIHRSRRLLVRWEKKGENYLAFLHLACAQLIFAKITVFG
ncbi:MAG TPA: IS5 family transposase [Ktedonobacteraceae bacterium]|jgi:putative transposase